MTERVRQVDAALRGAMLDCWVEVSNAGGAVGFLPPVTAAQVGPALDDAIAQVHAGERLLVVVRDPDAAGTVAAFGFLERQTGPVVEHRATVKSLQVHPAHRRRGLGAVVLRGLHREAAREGVRLVMLYYRSGLGLGRFYRRQGYVEVGRLPRSLRVATDDWRDDVWMAARLDPDGVVVPEGSRTP